MQPEIIQYIKNQLVRADDRLRPYVRTGTWNYPRRNAFFKIEKYLKDFLRGNHESRWVIIPGLRGVGKTTVVAQIFFWLQQQSGIKKNHVLYISVDDIVTAGFSLKHVLDAYESVLGQNFESVKDVVVLLIDEVQQDTQWAAVLKTMYDKARNVFVICTGSSAVQLQSNPDVARRGIYEKLYPLNFSEYQMLKNNIFPVKELKQHLKAVIYDSATAEEVHDGLQRLAKQVNAQWSRFKTTDVDAFLSTGTLPFTLQAQQMNIYERISLLIDRMINKDIQELGKFDIQTLGIIKRLLFIMADATDGLSVNKISATLGIDRNTLTTMLDALEKAEVIIRVSPHGSNISAVKKPSKFLFMSPAIRMSLLSITGLDETFLTRRGKLLEDIAGLHLYREFVSTGAGAITYDTAEGGADFVLQIANKKQIAIEVGMGDKELSQVRKTMEKVRCAYGIVICTSDAVVISKEDNIVKIPLQYFLLM